MRRRPSPRSASGAGKNASYKKASTACFDRLINVVNYLWPISDMTAAREMRGRWRPLHSAKSDKTLQGVVCAADLSRMLCELASGTNR